MPPAFTTADFILAHAAICITSTQNKNMHTAAFSNPKPRGC